MQTPIIHWKTAFIQINTKIPDEFLRSENITVSGWGTDYNNVLRKEANNLRLQTLKAIQDDYGLSHKFLILSNLQFDWKCYGIKGGKLSYCSTYIIP